jgi:hypothetical protein
MIYSTQLQGNKAAIVFIPLKTGARDHSRTNVVDEDRQSRPQGRVVVLAEED